MNSFVKIGQIYPTLCIEKSVRFIIVAGDIK
jgi:hypothetical protein